jgi:ubiquinone/menaquinone biosynthesis C-methylase UbiE
MMALRLAVVVIAIGLAAAAAAAFGAFLPWREEAEAERLAQVAGLLPGQSVAEIGAGTGRFTAAIARKVGTAGRVFSTELTPENRRAILDRITAAGLHNVTIIQAAAAATNLPDACCDVVFLRNVYHHIQEPERFAASLARAVKPGGALIVIDFEPGALWLHGGKPDDASRRPGHGVSRQDTIAELRSAGFEVRHEMARWSGPMWLVVFRAAQSD